MTVAKTTKSGSLPERNDDLEAVVELIDAESRGWGIGAVRPGGRKDGGRKHHPGGQDRARGPPNRTSVHAGTYVSHFS